MQLSTARDVNAKQLSGICRKDERSHHRNSSRLGNSGARLLVPWEESLSERIKSHPDLSGRRLYRDIVETATRTITRR